MPLIEFLRGWQWSAMISNRFRDFVSVGLHGMAASGPPATYSSAPTAPSSLRERRAVTSIFAARDEAIASSGTGHYSLRAWDPSA
jgi:hypothetical protein